MLLTGAKPGGGAVRLAKFKGVAMLTEGALKAWATVLGAGSLPLGLPACGKQMLSDCVHSKTGMQPVGWILWETGFPGGCLKKASLERATT